MTQHSRDPGRAAGERLEHELRAMLGREPQIAEARLRAIRGAVLLGLTGRHEYRLADFFRWRLALPVAASLLLCGAVLGWTVAPGGADQDLALALLDGGPLVGDAE